MPVLHAITEAPVGTQSTRSVVCAQLASQDSIAPTWLTTVRLLRASTGQHAGILVSMFTIAHALLDLRVHYARIKSIFVQVVLASMVLRANLMALSTRVPVPPDSPDLFAI